MKIKGLKDSLNEALKDQKKAEVLKGIKTFFNNVKEPMEALEFMWDTIEALQQAINDNNYSSTANPNNVIWSELSKELTLPMNDLSSAIEDLKLWVEKKRKK